MPSLALIVLFSLLFKFAFRGALSKTVTVQIDDAETEPQPFGQHKSVAKVTFYPPVNGFWGNQFGGTQFLAASPEPVNAFQQTFTYTSTHSGDQPRSIYIDFFGKSITPYFTLANRAPTECDITVDGKQLSQFRHAAGSLNGGDNFITYKVAGPNFSNLTLGFHRMEIKVVPFTNERPNYVNFDYVEITYETEDADKFFSELDAHLTGAPSPEPASTGSGDSAKIAGLVVGIIAGSIIIGSIILVFYFRSRANQSAPASSVKRKVDISQLEKQSDTKSQGSTFKRTLRNTFGRVMSPSLLTRNTGSAQVETVQVSMDAAYDPSQPYSVASSVGSDISSKAQPMYEEFGKASQWEDMTSLASSSPRFSRAHLATVPIQPYGGVASPKSIDSSSVREDPDGGAGHRRLKYGDSRLDSLGLHLNNIQAKDGLGDLASRANQATIVNQRSPVRDLTVSYQYSLSHLPVAPSVPPPAVPKHSAR